jgi:hypothetical protein
MGENKKIEGSDLFALPSIFIYILKLCLLYKEEKWINKNIGYGYHELKALDQ